MTMLTFDKLDYSVRPRKHIERILIFEALQTLEAFRPLSKYRYIGMGAMWFKDFILAHKLLRISDLISMEEEPEDAARANYNRPFSVISVVEGHTSVGLREIGLAAKPSVLWLDYEVAISPSVLEDTGFVCREIPNGSLVLITLNVYPPRANNFSGQEKKLRELAGALVPPNLPPTFFDAVPEAYPNNVCLMMLAHLEACLKNAGRNEKALPLFNFYYSDRSPMVTLGVAIADHVARDQFDKWRQAWPLPQVTGEKQFVIDAPNLTSREKLLFDQLLPSDTATITKELERLKLPFTAAHVERYGRFYREYPIYGEFLP